MIFQFDPGALLATTYALDDGTRARLRLLATSDARELRHLVAEGRLTVDPWRLERLCHYDPRRQVVLCARVFTGGSERLLGVGSIDLEVSGAAPELVLVDDGAASALGDLLAGALLGRADALARLRAA